MDYCNEISKYLGQTDSIMKYFIGALSPLYKAEFGIEQEVTIPLFTALHTTSESILILLSERTAVFDADVLLRTVFEGTIKYCYLMTGSSEERYQKYIEYKEKLTDIDRLSDHFKAVDTERTLKKYSKNSTVFLDKKILPTEEVERLQKLYPRQIKSELKLRWSYQHLLKTLAEKQSEYEAQLGTPLAYSFASHFIHLDWSGVSSRQEQISYAFSEKAVIYDLGHAIRISANLLALYCFRVIEYIRCNHLIKPIVIDHVLRTFALVNTLTVKGDKIIETGEYTCE